MGNTAAHKLGLAHADIEIPDSINGMIELVSLPSLSHVSSWDLMFVVLCLPKY